MDRKRLEERFTERVGVLDVHIDLIVVDGVDNIVNLGVERVPAIILDNDFAHPITLVTAVSEIDTQLRKMIKPRPCTCDTPCRRSQRVHLNQDRLAEPRE